MSVRSANALWNGTLQEGKGNIKLGSGSFEGQYSFSSRFEEGTGTNPEELIAAAHAGCISMQISATLGRKGFPATSVDTTAKVTMRRVDDVPTITAIELTTVAVVPDVDEATFQEVVADSKANCIISRALAAIPEITITATLKS
jgi:osmotically inducible protein OsmC